MGASFGGAALFVAIIGVVMIIVLRNRRKSCEYIFAQCYFMLVVIIVSHGHIKYSKADM